MPLWWCPLAHLAGLVLSCVVARILLKGLLWSQMSTNTDDMRLTKHKL